MEPLLDVKDLRVSFPARGREVHAVRGVSFSVAPGETVAVVGESGCGKTATALAIMRLLPPPGRITGGAVMYRGEDLLRRSEREMRRVRGREIAMVFQDPQSSLNPVLTVGRQITEVLREHRGLSAGTARAEAAALLRRVGIPAPESRLDHFPHQMSGGMRQRAMIAMALAGGPRLLIADEPTTALDATIRAQILDLLRDLIRDTGMATLLITHDLGVVAGLAQRVVVMYAGRAVEWGPVGRLFQAPAHPYTWSLLQAVPRAAGAGLPGPVPGPADARPPEPGALPESCPFHPRCCFALVRCRR